MLRHLHAPADQWDLEDFSFGQVFEWSRNKAGKYENIDETGVIWYENDRLP